MSKTLNEYFLRIHISISTRGSNTNTRRSSDIHGEEVEKKNRYVTMTEETSLKEIDRPV